MPTPRHGSTVIPTLSYRDAPAMIDWLCDAFGFEQQAVYADGDVVLHAQLDLRQRHDHARLGRQGRRLGEADDRSPTKSACAPPTASA